MSAKQKQKISHLASSGNNLTHLQQPNNGSIRLQEEPLVNIRSESPRYRYFKNIMRNLEEIKISWGLSSKPNQLQKTKIHSKLNELIHLIKK